MQEKDRINTIFDKILSGAEIDTLYKLIEQGPLETGDIPSKSGLVELMNKGFAVQIVNKQEYCHYAATTAGGAIYCNHLGVRTVKEGIEKRAMSEAAHSLNKIMRKS